MRKSTLLLAVLLAASVATTADAAKRKKMVAAPKAPVAYTNEQSAAFFRNAMFPWAMQPAAAPAKKVHVARKKSKKMKMKKA